MSYDVTGGGPMEAPIIELSVCTQIDPITFSLEDIHKSVKNQKFYSLWLLHCMYCLGRLLFKKSAYYSSLVYTHYSSLKTSSVVVLIGSIFLEKNRNRTEAIPEVAYMK